MQEKMTENKKVSIADIKAAVDKKEMNAFVKVSRTGTHILLKDNVSGETVQIGFLPRRAVCR